MNRPEPKSIMFFITGVMLFMFFVMFLIMLHAQHIEKLNKAYRTGYAKAKGLDEVPENVSGY